MLCSDWLGSKCSVALGSALELAWPWLSFGILRNALELAILSFGILRRSCGTFPTAAPSVAALLAMCSVAVGSALELAWLWLSSGILGLAASSVSAIASSIENSTFACSVATLAACSVAELLVGASVFFFSWIG